MSKQKNHPCGCPKRCACGRYAHATCYRCVVTKFKQIEHGSLVLSDGIGIWPFLPGCETPGTPEYAVAYTFYRLGANQPRGIA